MFSDVARQDAVQGVAEVSSEDMQRVPCSEAASGVPSRVEPSHRNTQMANCVLAQTSVSVYVQHACHCVSHLDSFRPGRRDLGRMLVAERLGCEI
jgi:hypothetical protein